MSAASSGAVFSSAIGIAFAAAHLFDISFALGAFFAGTMIRESDLNHEVADRALPFQDAFAVLFFVAVGMLFDPEVLLEEPVKVLLVSFIIIFGKSIAALAIILLFRYPLQTGFLVSAGLAQIGEFSFVLVNLGVAYALLPEEGRDLILAGAMISISVNPLLFKLSRKMSAVATHNAGYIEQHGNPVDDLSRLTDDEIGELEDSVILVGHGRVGKHISHHIQLAKMDLVIIDQNRERIEALRENGFHAIAGNASIKDTLRAAGIDKAGAIVIAVPDPFEARRIFETAREIKPSLKILVRAHNDEEVEYFATQNVNLVVTGAREIGARMVEYLHKMQSDSLFS